MSVATLAPSSAVCALVRLGEAYAHLLEAKRLRRDPSSGIEAPVSLTETSGRVLLEIREYIASIAGLDPKNHWGEAGSVRESSLPFGACEEHVYRVARCVSMAADDASDLLVDEHAALRSRLVAAQQDLENAVRSIQVARTMLSEELPF